VDVDAEVERTVNRSISELIRVEGEQKFRALEAEAIRKAFADGAQAISLGGGALGHEQSRARVEAEGFPVWLKVRIERAAERVTADEVPDEVPDEHSSEKPEAGRLSGEPKRPLLFEAGEAADEVLIRGRLRELSVRREAHYAVAPVRVWTDFADPLRVAGVIKAESEMKDVRKAGAPTTVIPDPLTSIVIGEGVIDSIGERLRALCPVAKNAAVIIDANVVKTLGEKIERSLQTQGFKVTTLILPSGETSKSSEELFRILEALAAGGLTRDDVLVGVGGGVVGDVSGFAASVYMRGIEHAQVPTTLVAQVDSALGGKTAVNLEHGKNLVGTFHPAKLVLSDANALATLPEREFISGLAEVVKYGLVFSAEFFADLERNVDAIQKRDRTILSRIVEQSSLFKTEVVVKDLHDRLGLRALLNFGHTVGHAIEKLSGYGELLHGEAVAIGMIQAIRIGASEAVTPVDLLTRAAPLLRSFGLPTEVPAGLLEGADEYLAMREGRKLSKPDSDRGTEFERRWTKALSADKKRGSDGLKFVLLEGIGQANVVAVEIAKAVRCIAAEGIAAKG